MDLPRLIYIDEDKCVNCHKCISVCPVKYCNDGSRDHINVNHNLCIGCGNCLVACTHEARIPLDDFDDFIKGIKNKDKIIAFTAPSIAVEFRDKYLQLNGYLKSIGVEQVFDVSFGAELTVESYINHIKNNNPTVVISQPCPAIVTYIQLYRPELIKYLAPADSPMAHTMRMVKNYYPQYRDYKFAVISPCIAKKREFNEIGIGDFNVTYKSLKKYFDDNNINLDNFEKVGYANPDAERAVLFSTPGGLLETAQREVKDIYSNSRKIEGVENIYHYLGDLEDSIKNKTTPLLIDCLNCEKGCNGGTGTMSKNEPVDNLDYIIRNRMKEMVKKYKSKSLFKKNRIKKYIKKFWSKDLYKREYLDLSQHNTIKIPNESELADIYKSMHKYSDSDLYNCSSCGYGNCKDMAIAIFNNLNQPQNCHYYKNSVIEENHKKNREFTQSLFFEIENILNSIVNINNFYSNLGNMIESQASMIGESSASIEEIMSTIGNVDSVIHTKITITENMSFETTKGNEEIEKLVLSITEISQASQKISDSVKSINEISEKTNLLSMNASIEAAHAGEYGKGFSVVASEIRKLAEQTGIYSKNISQSLKDIILKVQNTSDNTKLTKELIFSIFGDIKELSNSMKEIIYSIGEMHSESSQVVNSISELLRITENIRGASVELDSRIKSIEDSVRNITNLSEKI